MSADRVRGVLWGQAVGDALGTTVEFLTPAAIARRGTGDGWPGALVGAGPFGLLPGQVTDDTELALALARTLVAEGAYRDDAVAGAYLAWYRSGPFDCGSATGRAFGGQGGLRGGLAEAVRRRADPHTQANGSLMRASPLGLFGRTLPREALAALAAQDSTLSHPHPVCQAACAVFTATVAEAVSTALDGPALHAFAVRFAGSLDLTRPVLDTLLAAAAGPPADSVAQQGWVRHALQHAFYQLRRGAGFEASLVEVVRQGGDTDTNAAITGALLGGVAGEAGIPARWREAVQACPSPRPRAYHCADLPALAEALAPGA
jgi:ADP-ribosylglycohydrolase